MRRDGAVVTLTPDTLAALAALYELTPATRLRLCGAIVRATVIEALATDRGRAMAAAPHLACAAVALAHLTAMLAPAGAEETGR